MYKECPLSPRRTNFVTVSIASETHVPTVGGVGLSQSHLPRLAECLNTSRQLSGTPFGERSIQLASLAGPE